jgi:hypothetical protein
MQVARAPAEYVYQRHKPEESVLYKIIQENLETFLSLVREETGQSLPEFVEKEFYEYLRCGVLAHGFLRVQCESCHKESLVAFSCKRRGFCPSCGGRRMSETAIHLVDQVLPVKPIRQWVISFPFQIRLLLAIRPKIMGEVLRITHEAIAQHLRRSLGLTKAIGKVGAVTLIQRFGGSINLNVHFHQLFIDGVYELDANKEPTTFHAAPEPTRAELAKILEQIIARVTRLLERRGIIIRDPEQGLQIDLSDDDSFTQLQAGAISYRFAFGPNKGKKALTLKTVPEQDPNSEGGLVAKNSGFSLHAGVTVPGTERKKLEKLCRYIARPAIALERLRLNSSGQVVYSLKKPYSDGTTHIVMKPLELLEKIAAIIPRPRVHLTRFHGILAPHDKHRKLVVPKGQAPIAEASTDKPDEPPTKSRITWARLLKRVFNIDVEICAECSGKAKVIAAIEDPIVIRKILTHLGLPTKPPIIHPARTRGPPPGPSPDEDYSQVPAFDFD